MSGHARIVKQLLHYVEPTAMLRRAAVIAVAVTPLERSAWQFGRILSLPAEESRLPAVIHCAGGKDRTGMTVALLLTALGVDREDVLDDYAATSATAAHRTRLVEVLGHFVSFGVEEEAAQGMLSAPRWAMDEALTSLDESHGGVVPYLRGPAGLSTRTLSRLRRLLLDPEFEAAPS
jgi:protein-tyrosine phosphatase